MTIRLNKVTRDLNVGISTLVEFLQKKGYTVEANPNTKITEEQYNLLVSEFSTDKQVRQQAASKLKVVGKIDLDALRRQTVPKAKGKLVLKRENLNISNILFHFIVVDASPLIDENYIRLSYNDEGYYAQLPTLLYNKNTSVLFSTIEEESQDCSLYRILERVEITNLVVPKDDFLIIEGDYKYQLLLEELFNRLPQNFSIYNKIKQIHLQLLYNGKEYIEEIKWSDPNRSLIFALKTKPFVILSGFSGTGKSCKVVDLAKSFYNLSQQFQNKYTPNYNLQSVKPNWFDSTELLGYISPNTQNFVDTEFLNFVQQAESHPNTPYFVCLDEMNLARVEYYLAELLSKIEMRFFNSDGKYESICISTISTYKYTFPANLFIVGTVNMDDTTNSFSRKVLDRAMVFETPIPNLKLDFTQKNSELANIQCYSSDILLKDNIDIRTAYEKLGKHGEALVDFLIKCNEILNNTPFRFAYRLRNESLLYCYHNFRVKEKPQNWFNICLDEILNMKILPRVEGDRSEINECLIKLETLCSEQDLHNAKGKIVEMLSKFDLLGYTSYFN